MQPFRQVANGSTDIPAGCYEVGYLRWAGRQCTLVTFEPCVGGSALEAPPDGGPGCVPLQVWYHGGCVQYNADFNFVKDVPALSWSWGDTWYLADALGNLVSTGKPSCHLQHTVMLFHGWMDTSYCGWIPFVQHRGLSCVCHSNPFAGLQRHSQHDSPHSRIRSCAWRSPKKHSLKQWPVYIYQASCCDVVAIRRHTRVFDTRRWCGCFGIARAQAGVCLPGNTRELGAR